jgi:AraC-like DNA-binding protein
MELALRTAAAAGVDVQALMAELHIPPAVLKDPDGRVPYQLSLDVWRRAPELANDPAFGLHVAERLKLGQLELLDYVLGSSNTLGDFFRQLARYHRLLSDQVQYTLALQGGWFVLARSGLPGVESPRHAIESTIAFAVIRGRTLTGVDFRPHRVTFRHPPPPDTREHERVFQCPVLFRERADLLQLNPELLELPVQGANPGLAAVLQRHACEVLERLPESSGFQAQVRKQVVHLLTDGTPTLADCAAAMAMSVRTVQRRLEAEGISFNELLDQVRKGLATRYLDDDRLAISEIAYLLGFSDSSAFLRAFKRWVGVTPAAFRRKSHDPGGSPQPGH